MAVENNQVDEKTLNSLPVAVILFDNKHIYFLNKKAAEIFKVSKQQLKDLSKLTLFQFLDKKYHSRVRKNNELILKGTLFPAIELEFKDFKDTTICIEANSNAVMFNNKKVIQSTFCDVSERKNKTIEYENAQELLQKISTNSLDVIVHFTFSPFPTIQFISDSSKNMLGYTPAEVYKQPDILKARVHADDQHLCKITKADYSKLYKGEKNRKVLVRFKHKNGSLKHLEIAVNPVYDKKKQLSGLIGDIRDVSERTETEALLIETKDKFDLITKNGNDIIAFYTYFPVEGYLYVSPNIKKILGYEPKSLQSDTMFFTKRLAGQNEEFVLAEKLLKSYQKKNIVKNYHYAFKIFDKNKEELWLENNLVPITNSKGKITFYLNIIRNITEQKDKELEIQNQYINYRNLLDNSPVAYVINDHGNILYTNNALLKLLKVKNKAQVVGKFSVDFFKDTDRKKAINRINEVYETKKQNKFINYNLVDVEGNTLEVEIKSVLIKFNNTDCVLSLVNNLSEQRQREREKVKALITETDNKQLQNEIKERQEVEKNLIEKTAHLSSIFENSTHLIWTVNKQLKVTSFNQNFHDVVMLQHNISIKPGYKIDEHLLKDRNAYINFWYTRYAEAFTGKKLEFEKEDFNGKKVFRKIFINPILNKDGEVTDISCIAHDITDSKIYEQKLVSQTGKLSAIFDSSSHYIWTINREDKLTSFNKKLF